MNGERLNRPVSTMELFASGNGVIGDPERLSCPHCGHEARAFEVTTPRLGLTLTLWLPPFGCCPRAPKRGS